MRLLIRIIVFFLLVDGNHSQAPVTFCDLLRSPDKYNGKEVRVRATYRYGFEWSELYCLDCLDKGKAWLDLVAVGTTAEPAFRRLPKGAGIVNLTVEGVFVSGNTYGHQNGYRYQITPGKISDVKVVQKGGKSRTDEEKAEKRWACGGTIPNSKAYRHSVWRNIAITLKTPVVTGQTRVPLPAIEIR